MASKDVYSPTGSKGFTLIELVMVITIVGVIALLAVPRMFDRGIFESRGFADQVQAALRHAQKIAIAQRRFACVAFTANTVTVTTDATAACAPGTPFPHNGQANYVIAAPSGVTLAGPPANLSFDALGRPSAGQSIAVSGAPNNIVVEAETGYVHSP